LKSDSARIPFPPNRTKTAFPQARPEAISRGGSLSTVCFLELQGLVLRGR
jgi:hypothetical protein